MTGMLDFSCNSSAAFLTVAALSASVIASGDKIQYEATRFFGDGDLFSVFKTLYSFDWPSWLMNCGFLGGFCLSCFFCLTIF